MNKKSENSQQAEDRLLKGIRRQARKQYSAEDKIRIVLAGLRGEESIAALCRREGIAMRYVSLLETGKRQPTISTIASICDALEVSMSAFMKEIEGRL